MKKALYLLAMLLLTFTITGCTWSRIKYNVEDFHTRAARVKVGQTNAADLEKIFGSAPNTIIPGKDDKSIYVYNFGDTKTNGLTLIIVNISKSNVRTDSAYFFVNNAGVVEKASISNNSEDVPWEWWAFGE